MSLSEEHALVFGASGLIGWAVVDELLSSHPPDGISHRVTAVTNRPITAESCSWHVSSSTSARLNIVSGVDLSTNKKDDLLELLKRRIPDVETVTHLYYFVFKPHSDDTWEAQVNKRMLEGLIDVINVLCLKLRFVVFPGGTRGYGIYIPGGTFKAPLVESLVNTLPEDYEKTVAYPLFRQVLSTASEGKPWTWCEICPDVIVGFTPNGSAFSLALHWAQYLSLYAKVNKVSAPNDSHGKISLDIPFPGSLEAFTARFTPVSAKTIARFAMFAGRTPALCGNGQLFNIADQSTPTTFQELWPQLTAWFDLNGVEPNRDGQPADGLKPGEYIAKYRHLFLAEDLTQAVANGVGSGASQLDSVGWWLNFDRHLSLTKLKGTGFGEEQDPAIGWLEAFGKFRQAGLIF